MRLRRQLDPRAAARIVTRAPGYLIEISGDELDASAFEALTMRAGAAVRAGHWTQAGRTASQALGLWRGAALTDVPSQSLRDRWLPPNLAASRCRLGAATRRRRASYLPGSGISPAEKLNWTFSPLRWECRSRRATTRELTDANLVTEHAPGRYLLHDLLRAYAAGQARAQDAADWRHAALHRVLDHYVRAACAAARLFSPSGQPPRLPDPLAGVIDVRLADRDEAVTWCQAELAVLSAAVSCAASSGFATHAWQLAWAAETIPDQWRRWQDQVAAGEITLAAAGQAGDRYGQAYAHRHLGRALTVGGDHHRARDHLLRAQVLFCRLGDRLNQAETELALAMILVIIQEPARSLARSWHAQQVYQAEGDRFGHAVAVYRTGWAHTELGRYERGLALCEQALELAGDADDPFSWLVRSSTLDMIGIAHHHLGQHDAAIASYQKALGILHNIGEVWLTAFPLDHLGDSYQAAGDAEAAREAWKQAISAFEYAQLPGADVIHQKVRDLDER